MPPTSPLILRPRPPAPTLLIPQRPRLRTVLLLVNVGILLLPLMGIAILRLYENELIRQTESELIGQGAFVRAIYHMGLTQAVQRLAESSGQTPQDIMTQLSVPADASILGQTAPETQLDPVVPQLNLPRLDLLRSNLTDVGVLPRPPEPPPGATPIDPLVQRVGALLTPLLKEAQRVTLASIRVTDARGIIIAATRGQEGRSLLGQQEVVRALKGENVSVLRERISDEAAPPLTSISRGTRVRIYVSMPVLEGTRVLGAVLLSRSPVPVDKALYENRQILLLSLMILLAIVLAVTAGVSFTITRPMNALVELSEQVMRGQTAQPLERPFTREVARLSESLVQMASTLKDRGDYIRTFARHVSHEFKTPLTSMRGAIELLQDHLGEMSEDELRHFFDNLQQDTERMERLVQRLLELAKAELSTPPDGGIPSQRRQHDMPQVLTSQLSDCVRSAIETRGPHCPQVIMAFPESLPYISMPSEALESVLAHLLDNVAVHAPGARVQLIAQLESSTESNTFLRSSAGQQLQTQGIKLLVEDDGPGISEGNAKRIFEPFFTTARSSGGTGMGLPIVKALLEAHGGSIQWVPTTQGTLFEIWLPTVQA